MPDCTWQHNCKNLSLSISVLACFPLSTWRRRLWVGGWSLGEPAALSDSPVNSCRRKLDTSAGCCHQCSAGKAVCWGWYGSLSSVAQRSALLLFLQHLETSGKSQSLCKMFEQLKSCRRGFRLTWARHPTLHLWASAVPAVLLQGLGVSSSRLAIRWRWEHRGPGSAGAQSPTRAQAESRLGPFGATSGSRQRVGLRFVAGSQSVVLLCAHITPRLALSCSHQHQNICNVTNIMRARWNHQSQQTADSPVKVAGRKVRIRCWELMHLA